MFCRSLRRRPSCDAIVPTLMMNPGLHLLESDLNTHDIELQLATQQPTSTSNSSSKLHILLLSPSSLTQHSNPNAITTRLQQFANSSANIAIVFQLTDPPTPNFITAKQLTERNSTSAYIELQTLLINQPELPHIPILLLSKPQDITEVLQTHVARLSSRPRAEEASSTTAFQLLRLCTAGAPPMSQQTAFYISDLFANLQDLASACVDFQQNSTRADGAAAEGPRQQSGRPGFKVLDCGVPQGGVERLVALKDLVGEREFRDMVGFWTDARQKARW